MKSRPIEAECNRILIVEGYSDLLFFDAFLDHLDRKPGVFIHQLMGKSNILNRKILGGLLSPMRVASKDAIGIVIDADNDAAATKLAIGNLIEDITGRKLQQAVWDYAGTALGFFVAPDGTNPGEIETLVWNVWSQKAEHAAGKASVMTHLSTMETAGWQAKSPDKARIGAFLSAAYDEDPRLGAGAREGLFDFDDPGFDRLRKFLMEFTASPSPQP